MRLGKRGAHPHASPIGKGKEKENAKPGGEGERYLTLSPYEKEEKEGRWVMQPKRSSHSGKKENGREKKWQGISRCEYDAPKEKKKEGLNLSFFHS